MQRLKLKKLLTNRGNSGKQGNPHPRRAGTLGSPLGGAWGCTHSAVGALGVSMNQPGTYSVFKFTKVWVANSAQRCSEQSREVWEERGLW